MKVIKKICIYFLVALLTFSSITLSYEKANTCKAVEIGLGIGLGVITVALVLYGSYYVSQPENQEEIKESLSNYKDMTEDGMKATYEVNKKLFNDFVDYATSKGGGSSKVYTADGRSYSIDEMAVAGFPEFDDWDKEMKKQGDSSSGGFGSIWDKLSFGLDLLDFIRGFFNDSDNIDIGPGTGADQSYFQGEDGYIDRETGELHFFVNTLRNYRYWNSDVSPRCWNLRLARYTFTYSSVVNASFRSEIRVCLYTGAAGTALPYEGDTTYTNYERFGHDGYLLCKNSGNLYTSTCVSDVEYEGLLYYFTDKTSVAIGLDDLRYSCYCNSEGEPDYSNYLFISTNLPVFSNLMDANNYIKTGDYSAAINLPPTVTPEPEPTEAGSPPSAPTAVDVYCNHFKGNSFSPANVVNVNYNIANNWDGTTENLTIILNGTNDVTSAVTPTATASPIPTLSNDDGSNTTNNFFINITNILNPIKVTVENIYNFFIIDTEQISSAWDFDNIMPAASFKPIIDSMDKLATAFGSDVYEEDEEESESDSNFSKSASIDGASGGGHDPSDRTGGGHDVDSSRALITEYPKIEFPCPTILEPFLKANEDGEKTIIICDFEDYAIYFVRFRFFLKAVIWIGMIFYLMKQLRVTFHVG